MGLLKHPQVTRLEDHVSDALKREIGVEKLFSVAPFSEEQAEQTGSGDYSYWRSTFRAFRSHWISRRVTWGCFSRPMLSRLLSRRS